MLQKYDIDSYSEKKKKRQGKNDIDYNSESICFISVITPCFNSEKTIARTIESVLAQSYQNFEYIIIDGGSTDKTIDIILDYLPRFNGKLKYISEKDRGIYDAMNKGIKMSQGTLVGIINSDDYYEPDCLEQVVAAYEPETKYLILYGAVRFVNQTGEELKILINNDRDIRNSMVLHPATFVSNTIYHEMFLYDTKYHYSSDLDFMIKAKNNNQIVFHPIYHVLSNFCVGGASYTKEAELETANIRYLYGHISKKLYRYIVLKKKTKITITRIFKHL